MIIFCTSILVLLYITAVSSSFANPVAITGPNDGTCPSREKREEVIQNLTASVRAMLRLHSATNRNCGAGEWHLVVLLNMTDPSQQCPPAWREYNTSGIRAYGRSPNTRGSCKSVLYSTGHVCGKWKRMKRKTETES